ncbi:MULTISPECIES: hypothetical protein [Streptomyces]|uniref:hypothetical protein n=1 Tax=Streptomyces TaxID=1883 RepID=UPI00101E85C3|nr:MULTISPECIES: hypothetical protein [Streptomyces]MCO6747832.1 hypothetical protein [Streptomyces sp. IpFD-1.1]RZD85255.1 hypothetical protein C0Q60_07575 [Streptomyces albidoflavus]RZE01565.1 hypothetical protein C0Q62_07475 [Streptomyces albidoflavus]
MSADVIPKAQAIAAARAVLDRARVRIARDRAAGRLSPEHELICRRLERQQAREQIAHQAAA